MNCWSQHFEAIDKANEEASSSSTSTTPSAPYAPVGGAAYPSNLFSYQELVVMQMGGPCFADTAILTPVDRLPGRGWGS